MRLMLLPVIAGLNVATGACMAPAVTVGSYAADGGLLAASNKTSTDHLLSIVTKQDCALWRALHGQEICKPRVGDTDPYDVNYSDPQRTVAEDGIRYLPPLRHEPGAPAASWEPGAYRPPASPVPPAAPLPATAVADAAAGPVSPSPAPPISRKAGARPVKPSRGPAAPGS